MKHAIKAPHVGESITEVSLLKWTKQSGEAVKQGEMIVEIESDKATVELVAEQSGVLIIGKAAGERVPVGEVIGEIDDAASATVASSAPAKSPPKMSPVATPSAPTSAPALTSSAPISPAVRKIVEENNLQPAALGAGSGKGGRLTKGDVISHLEKGGSLATASAPAAPTSNSPSTKPGERRVPMTTLRKRIAERLVQAQHTAAILTTFNECDMSAVMKLRGESKDAFKAKHGVPLSFMSFFARASVEALKVVPAVNAFLDGTDILYHEAADIGIAVGTEKGLVVPVIKGASSLDFVGLEKKLAEMAEKARMNKLSIPDMTGGTFTISNGGVYGSLLSTPILNPPQSGILGMHKIQERPIAINGKVEIRPMMYLALSYDHRIIDGKEAVTFLVQVKDFIENPSKLGFSF